MQHRQKINCLNKTWKRRNEKVYKKKKNGIHSGIRTHRFCGFPFYALPCPTLHPQSSQTQVPSAFSHRPKQGIIPADLRLKETRHVGDWRVRYNTLNTIP